MTDHLIQLRYSRDANNWVAWRDLAAGDTGAFGRELIARRLGQARWRTWEVCDTSAYAADILAASILTELSPDWTDFPLPDGSYSDVDRPWSQQDVVNYLPTFAAQAGARSRSKYVPVPGLEVFASIGAGPHRGAHDVEGTLFVVSGTHLYRVAADGTATSLGTIPGTGRVVMSHNQIASGNQLVIGNGSAGYVYNTVTEAFAQITDAGFPGLKATDFLGQYILGVEPLGRYWFHSDLADATSYNTLDRYEAETAPDKIQGLIASHNEVLVFGNRTIEPWVNDPTGNTAGTAFQLNRGSVVERGCAAGATICRLDNSVVFLGDDGIVYRLNGYTPVPISTQAQAAAWRDLDWSRAFAFTFEDRGYVIYYLTFPDGQTWGFDLTSGKSHRRESFTFDRWRLNTLVKCNGEWYGGDFQNGRLHRLRWGYVYEGCELMPRRLRTGVVHADGNDVTIDGFKLLANTGGAASESQEATTPPTITGALPDATVGDAVSYQYTLTRAYPGQDVTLTVNGTFPPGLDLDSDGLVTGTPTTAGSYSFTITPSSACADGVALSEAVVIADTITSAILADAPVLYWKLNETSGTAVTDYSGNGYHGTHTGSDITLTADGAHYTATTGGTYRSHAAGVPSIGDDSGWTIMAVVTRDAGALGSVEGNIALVSNDLNFGRANAHLCLHKSSAIYEIQGQFRGNVDDVTYAAATGTDYPTATRQLLVARRTPTGTTIDLDVLVNGAVVASYGGAALDATIAKPEVEGFYVAGGQTGFPGSYGFLGTIAHVALFNTAVSDARALYYAQLLGLA